MMASLSENIGREFTHIDQANFQSLFDRRANLGATIK
jgi:hypothetical protein